MAEEDDHIPLVVIAGRPNVGKSTIFNKLLRKKLAIVHDRPGVTRDWKMANLQVLREHQVKIVDTAGFEESRNDSLAKRVFEHAQKIIKKAELILFVIDGREGLTPDDHYYARQLRKLSVPIIVIVNKCDDARKSYPGMAEVEKLGFHDTIMLSAEHSKGLDVLIYRITTQFYDLKEEETDSDEEDEDFFEDNMSQDKSSKKIDFALLAEQRAMSDEDEIDPDAPEEEEEERAIHFVIAGRPNVGKSTLANAILGEDRMMTGPEAGVTRDSVSCDLIFKDKLLRLIDTAGLRKRIRITDDVEKMSMGETYRAIRLAHVVILVIDGTIGLDKQDLLIAKNVVDEGRCLIIAINKLDEIREKRQYIVEYLDRHLKRQLPQIKGVPYLFISAKSKENVPKLLDEVLKIYALWNKRFSTSMLNKWLRYVTDLHPTPLVEGKRINLKYMTQVKARPPTFALFVSKPLDLPGHYLSYLTNKLREDFDFPAVPIRIMLRKSKINPFKPKK